MRLAKWIGGAARAGSWYLMYLEVTRWRHVKPSLAFNSDPVPESGASRARRTSGWILDVTINGDGKAQLSQLTTREVHAVVRAHRWTTSVTGSGTVTRGSAATRQGRTDMDRRGHNRAIRPR
jgi:hypothetical protein